MAETLAMTEVVPEVEARQSRAGADEVHHFVHVAVLKVAIRQIQFFYSFFICFVLPYKGFVANVEYCGDSTHTSCIWELV